MSPDDAKRLESLERDLPPRLIVIGDLNAQANSLQRYLLDLRLITKSGGWSGGRSVLVQIGDVPNRGAGARMAMDLLLKLRDEARDKGGDVLWMLGNHEVLSTLGHEAYVYPEEYLEFADATEIETFDRARTRMMHQLIGFPRAREYIAPIGGRLRSWEEENAPGRAQYRKMMGPSGKYGKAIRKLPIAARFGTVLIVHGGLSPKWAHHGIAGLDRLLQQAWAARPMFYDDLDPQGILRDPLGPLWHRVYCLSSAKDVRVDLCAALKTIGATQMIVGHTRVDATPGGKVGVPLARHGGRLLMSDVGIGDPGEPGAVLVIEKGRIEAHEPGGSQRRVGDVRKRA